jgi:3-hydroxyisobutyrate dehydrogenase
VYFAGFHAELQSHIVPAQGSGGGNMKIGVAGLGSMGAAIAARLLEAGHEVVVWNRSPAKTKPLVDLGARVVPTPEVLAEACEAVITILTDGAAIDAVYNGPNGLLSGEVKGRLFIEMSTVPPKVPLALAPKVRAKGAAMVECPVGGSTVPARQGKLLGLMGAESTDAVRAKPILDHLCRRLEHCGPIGTGASMKLAINLPLMVAWQAYGEAFAIARDVGWEAKRLLDLFVDTNGANPALKARAEMIVTMFEGRDPGPTTFSIANAVKDLRTMVEVGESEGAEMLAAKAALAGFEDATKHGFGGGDGSRLSVYWADRKR